MTFQESPALESTLPLPVSKGLPLNAHGLSTDDFLATKRNIFTSDFQFPTAVILATAIEHNLLRMAEYCQEMSASLAPHVKTVMSPKIARMQIDSGAWALTVANYTQARIFLDRGFNRIIIANEIVNTTAIRSIALKNLDPTTEIIFYVDSLAGLDFIQRAISTLADARIHLLIEIGFTGGRCGLRDLQDVSPLAQKIATDSRFTLRGVSGFEGIIGGDGRAVERISAIQDFCHKIIEAAQMVAPYIKSGKGAISAGGSAFFDVVAEEFNKHSDDFHSILRSGGYIAHDHGSYERLYPFADAPPDKRFLPAIEIWSQVISKPESNVALLDLGKRDVGNDIENPFPIKRFRGKMEPFSGSVKQLNDQHGYLTFPENGSIELGDLVGLGISHPCTTFDKWKLIPLVNDDYTVVDLIETFF